MQPDSQPGTGALSGGREWGRQECPSRERLQKIRRSRSATEPGGVSAGTSPWTY